MEAKVFIVILNLNRKEDTAECISSIKKINYKNYDVVAIDNGSTDGSVEYLRSRYPDLKIIANNKNLGYPGGNNVGIRYALGKGADYILILNNDTIVTGDFLNILVDKADTDEKIGVVGPKLKFPGGEDQPSGRHFLSPAALVDYVLLLNGLKKDWKAYCDNFLFKNYDMNSEHEVDDVSGCVMLIRTEVFKEIGLLDEGYMYCFEETDFEKRAKEKGWRIWFVPRAHVYHKWIGATYLGGKKTYFIYKGLLRYAGKHMGLAYVLFFSLFVPICYSAAFIMRVLRWIRRRIK